MAAEGRIREAAYGTWDSPISPELVSNAVLRFDAVSVHVGCVLGGRRHESQVADAKVIDFANI